MKKIMIINASPHRHGNCDLLCSEFGRGALTNGDNEVIRIDLLDKKYDYYGEAQADDGFNQAAHQMMDSNVIVMATPVYFYNMSGQLKVFLDRLLPYSSQIHDKDFYFILTSAFGKKAMEPAAETLYGFTDSLADSEIRGIVYGYGVGHPGDVLNHPAMREVYEIAAGL
jgi:multimeric flavodoxin WrbA